MTKKKDFTSKVMRQVALKQRRKLFVFMVSVLTGLVVVFVLFVFFGRQLWFSATQEGVVDFFQAVIEDCELFKTTWQEVLVLFWQEFEKIFLLVFGLGLIILLILLKKRQKISNLPKNFKEVKHYLKGGE